MTFDQDKWDSSACASRCLLEIKRRAGIVISPEDFVAPRLHKYPHWHAKPGITDTKMVCELAEDLGIASQASVYIDPKRIREEVGKKGFVAILGFTERLPDKGSPGGLAISYHCLLLTIEETRLQIWNPRPKGAFEEHWFDWSRWTEWMMHGLVLYR